MSSTQTAHSQNFAGTVAPEQTVVPAPGAPEIRVPVAAEETTADAPDDVLESIRQGSHYSLGETDIVEIQVLRHPEVSGQYMINNEGNIQYEFVGDIYVEGKTKDEVKESLVKRLSEFIIAPEVTVKIAAYNSKIVYVIGEVGSPGKIFMRGDTMTVREALVQAGLPLLSAKTAHSRVITPSADGTPEERRVNVHKLLYKGDLREDLVMKPGDTLYVPPTFLAKTMRVLQPIAAPIGTAAGTGRTVMAPGF
jgi:polysaccharide export outer membrane protein